MYTIYSPLGHLQYNQQFSPHFTHLFYNLTWYQSLDPWSSSHPLPTALPPGGTISTPGGSHLSCRVGVQRHNKHQSSPTSPVFSRSIELFFSKRSSTATRSAQSGFIFLQAVELAPATPQSLRGGADPRARPCMLRGWIQRHRPSIRVLELDPCWICASRHWEPSSPPDPGLHFVAGVESNWIQRLRPGFSPIRWDPELAQPPRLHRRGGHPTSSPTPRPRRR